MDALGTIAGMHPRERGGRIAAARNEFQKCWAILEALERISRREEFFVLFEHLEDVAFLSGDSADIYQVKGKDAGRWSVRALVKVKKGRGSVLSRLWSSYEVLSGFHVTWNVVSNGPLNTRLRTRVEASAQKRVRFVDLATRDRKVIRQAMLQQGASVRLSKVASRTYFRRCTLSNLDVRANAIGPMSLLLDEFSPGIRTRDVRALLESLLHQIDSVSVNELLPSTPEEVAEERCIRSVNIVDAIYEAARPRMTVKDAWENMVSTLGMFLPPAALQKTHGELVRLLARASDASDEATQCALAQAREYVGGLEMPLNAVCQRAAELPQEFGLNSAAEAVAMVIYVSLVDGEVSKAGQKSEDGA